MKFNILKKTIDIVFLKYVVVGVLNTIMGLCLIYFFQAIMIMTYDYSYFISYLIGFIINFYIKKKFVFKSYGNNVSELKKYVLSYMVSYAISHLTLTVSVELIEIEQKYGIIISMVVYTCVFYILNRYFAFVSKGDSNEK